MAIQPHSPTQRIHHADWVLTSSKDKHLKLLVRNIPKTASSSMISFMTDHKATAQGRKYVDEVPERLSLIRHPVERVLSAWNNVWGRQHPDFSAWWEEVRTEPGFDVHTKPQAQHLGDAGFDLYRLEEIGTVIPFWYEKYPDFFPAKQKKFYQRNKAKSPVDKTSISEVILEDIARIYSDDLALWTAASIDGHITRHRQMAESGLRDGASERPGAGAFVAGTSLSPPTPVTLELQSTRQRIARK